MSGASCGLSVNARDVSMRSTEPTEKKIVSGVREFVATSYLPSFPGRREVPTLSGNGPGPPITLPAWHGLEYHPQRSTADLAKIRDRTQRSDSHNEGKSTQLLRNIQPTESSSLGIAKNVSA
ncbi:hypothetical protein M378DRAFT_800729 [Amanita muscaria Koide BX008]|uniref:Uncharacterized protein n=1 Tax=Amanita muscaria (strain Koide BX008) TaxID=946122 RepID=A0A0C2X0F0_AMAMK|nr:hypothetical protein M378DRAFT_800729 [Amanita muscaria Koide BX008]